MASILGNYLRARESVRPIETVRSLVGCLVLDGHYLFAIFWRQTCILYGVFTCHYLRFYMQAYFKLEQEAAVQEHRQKLLKEGKISSQGSDADAVVAASTRSTSTSNIQLQESEKLYEVNPEILQAQARVEDPNAARKRRFGEVRNVKPWPDPPTQEEIHRAQWGMLSSFGMGMARVPRMSLGGRHRFSPARWDEMPSQPIHHITPESLEVSQRSFTAGMRAFAWGSFLGFSLLGIGGVIAWKVWNDARSTDSSSGGQWAEEWRARIQRAFAPRKEEWQRWTRSKFEGLNQSSVSLGSRNSNNPTREEKWR